MNQNHQPGEERPRLLLVDDHPILLEGLVRLLEPEHEICGQLTSGEALVAAVRDLDPDVVILDYQLPGTDAVQVLQELEDDARDVRVIVLTMHEDHETASRVLAAGASAYVIKRSASSELLTAIREVLEGRRFISDRVAEALKERQADQATAESEELVIRSLTPRQREIIKSLCAGEVAKQTASKLGVSRKTVEYHKYRVMRQLGCKSTAELIRFAVRRGLD